MSSINSKSTEPAQRYTGTTVSSRLAWNASIDESLRNRSSVDTRSTSVDYEFLTNWPTSQFWDPLTVTYDAGVYHVSSATFDQTPGTFYGSYTVTAVSKTGESTVVASGGVSNVDRLEFDFQELPGTDYYIFNLSCTDNYYGTTVSGTAKIFPVGQTA